MKLSTAVVTAVLLVTASAAAAAQNAVTLTVEKINAISTPSTPVSINLSSFDGYSADVDGGAFSYSTNESNKSIVATLTGDPIPAGLTFEVLVPGGSYTALSGTTGIPVRAGIGGTTVSGNISYRAKTTTGVPPQVVHATVTLTFQ